MNNIGTLCLFLTLIGCSQEPTNGTVPLIVMVVDEANRPVARASVSIDSIRGMTDRSGKLETELSGPEGRLVQVDIECPNGWVTRGETHLELPVRFLKSMTSTGDSQVPIEVLFECVQKTRKVVLLVRTDGRFGLDVKALGRKIATTDEDGVTQTIFEGEPGDEFEVSIDTSSIPTLRPSMPSRRLTIPRDSQILVFDQKFEEKQKKKRSRKKRNKRLLRPRRI